MTQNDVSVPQWREQKGSLPPAPLTLRQMVPPDWHRDRPAFPGDPYMDWESQPEPPGEVQAEKTMVPARRPL